MQFRIFIWASIKTGYSWIWLSCHILSQDLNSKVRLAIKKNILIKRKEGNYNYGRLNILQREGFKDQ